MCTGVESRSAFEAIERTSKLRSNVAQCRQSPQVIIDKLIRQVVPHLTCYDVGRGRQVLIVVAGQPASLQ